MDYRIKEETYRRIVSGSDQGIVAVLLRVPLGIAGILYGLIMSVRNVLYDRGLLTSHSAGVPVICIGNLTTGGTGKTPLVIWLCNYLQGKGIKCAILTRGYRTHSGQMSDEPALLAKACNDVPVIVNSDRAAGAQKAVEKYQAQLLIMDDGFQHRRLRRDLDIVAIDATCPFGYGKVLPGGLLRESVNGLKRAGAVIITRSDQVDQGILNQIEEQIQTLAPGIPVGRTQHQHRCGVTFGNERLEIAELRSRKLFAFCGIGNPDAFFSSLRQSGLQVAATKTFDDHHLYSPSDIESLFTQARECGADTILCTQKDWVKCALLVQDKHDIVFAYLAMDLDFSAGLDTIHALINEKIIRKL